ncbi:MAG: glycosyltransferase [Candidatus Electronema sp. V4]|uniref:glycosyltransferase n=1 Tax=Candidatus Electronema sp. V4 TaxID=3454756 RepID=UPI0040555C05
MPPDRPRRVLIYLDSAAFGGHEVTLIEAVKGLLAEPTIALTLLVPQANQRLLEQLKRLDLGGAAVIEHSFHTEPGDVFRVLLRSPKVRRLRQELRRHQPDLVIVSQGAIALSACGLGAARSAGIPLMSFLPMAHPVALVRGQNGLAIRLQELLYRRLYALPNYFLTICTTAKEQLHRLHGVALERIFVQYFGLDYDRSQPLALPRKSISATKHVALIGRIEFQQKRHDFFLRHFAAQRSELPPLHIHLLGDGPDRERLLALTEELNLGDAVSFEGWAENMDSWYQQLDAVLLPSRFEGVPVVMLEAMRWGLPVLASNLDGMAEMLPQDWLFPADDGAAMIRRLKTMLVDDQQEHLLRNRRRVDQLDTASFRAGFRETVCACLVNGGK